MFSREPISASSLSGTSSAWGNVQPESEVMRMLLAANWKPEVLGEVPQTPQEYFRRINEIIVSIGGGNR